MEAMIEFNSQNGYELPEEESYRKWLIEIAKKEGYEIQDLGYVFCSDNFLLDINQRYLDHDTLTDIITFDYCEDRNIAGEIYISTDRVSENASSFDVDFITELRRVIAHGLLHLCSYKDKTDQEKKMMREKESYYISQFG